MEKELLAEVRSFEAIGNLRMNYDDSKTPKLMGLAVNYNIISDEFIPENPHIKEKIAVGAFRSSVASDDIKLQWQHNSLYILGRTRAGTLSLTENEKGVYFVCTPPDVGWARDLVVSIKRGDISNMSFKFSGKAHYERSGDGYLQVVDEGRLSEISVVENPVYHSTSVFSRSADGIFLVDGKPIEMIENKVETINPPEINMVEELKRLEKVNKRNTGGF